MHAWPCFGPQSLAEPPLLSCLSWGSVGIPSPAGSQESLASCRVVLGCGSEIGTHLQEPWSQHQEPRRPQWCLSPSCTSAERATSAGLPPSVGPRTGLRLCLLSSVSHTLASQLPPLLPGSLSHTPERALGLQYALLRFGGCVFYIPHPRQSPQSSQAQVHGPWPDVQGSSLI